MNFGKTLFQGFRSAVNELGLGQDLSDLVKTRQKLKRMSKMVTANERDVRIWFTGLDAVFEGSYLEEYPKDYKQAIQAPWPQPSPHAPGELPPTVLHVPEEEVTEFLQKVVGRYISTLKSDWMDALLFAHRTGSLVETSDARFGDLFLTTPLGKSISSKMDPLDFEIVESLKLQVGQDESIWKMDFSPMDGVDLFPEMNLEPCVAYFARKDLGDTLRPLGIRMRHTWVQPPQSSAVLGQNSRFTEVRNRAAWETAKQLTLQAAAVHLIASMHPVVHFPVDSINAITKAVLPQGHPLRELLAPHCYMQLPLNFAVLYIDRSVAHNHQREIYSALPTKRSGFFELMKKGYRGVPENSAYPSYSYRVGTPEIPTPYGEFLAAYYPPILEFAREICTRLNPQDSDVRRWLEALSQTLPGFPAPAGSESSFSLDLEWVSQVAATFIHNCAVVHSADHHCYAKLPLDQVPLRMRVGEDQILKSPTQAIGEKIKKSDLFRHRMAWKMYFKPTNIRLLKDVTYAFSDPSDQMASEKFHNALMKMDLTQDSEKYMSIEEMASSIQY